MLQTFRATPVFAIAVLIGLALIALNGLMIMLMQLIPGFLGMAHFTEPGHRIHDLTFSFTFVPAGVGLLVQLWAPARNRAGQLMALIPWIALLVTVLLTQEPTRFSGLLNPAWLGPALLTVISAALHPTGGALFRSVRSSQVSWVVLTLVVIAAVPLLAMAWTNVGLQRTVQDDHALMGHYGFMAALGFTAVGVGILASLRPDGWRLTAWMAGLLPALLGVASLIYPGISSSLDPLWAIAAMAWGAVFVGAAELIRTRGGVTAAEAAGPPAATEQAPGRGGLRAGSVIAVVVILGVLAFVARFLLAGGHGPQLH